MKKLYAKNSERRATDRVVEIWKAATNRETIKVNIDSVLWDSCFLLALDELMDCSVILDHGDKAGSGLNLLEHKAFSFRSLPRGLREKVFFLSGECVKTRNPRFYSEDHNDMNEINARQYRLVLLPLIPSDERDRPLLNRVTNVLGVFTFK
jgi:hypothetical protein